MVGPCGSGESPDLFGALLGRDLLIVITASDLLAALEPFQNLRYQDKLATEPYGFPTPSRCKVVRGVRRRSSPHSEPPWDLF